MRYKMRALVDIIKNKVDRYPWGHPFHLIIHMGFSVFVLHNYEQLEDAFRFLGVDPIPLQNWLDFETELRGMKWNI